MLTMDFMILVFSSVRQVFALLILNPEWHYENIKLNIYFNRKFRPYRMCNERKVCI